MKSLLKLPLLFILAIASCTTKQEPPKTTSVLTVPIPATVKTPKVDPVKKSLDSLVSKVDSAESQVVKASQTAADSAASVARLQKVIDDQFYIADSGGQVDMEKIKKAAIEAETKVRETQEQLNVAVALLGTTQGNTKDLYAKISSLRSEIAVQSNQIEQFRSAAVVANQRLTFALSERDKFANSLSSVTADIAVQDSKITRLKKHRFWLIAGISCLVITNCGLAYLLFKP